GVVYRVCRQTHSDENEVITWPRPEETTITYRKVPTITCYTLGRLRHHDPIVLWGNEARRRENSFAWTKLLLDNTLDRWDYLDDTLEAATRLGIFKTPNGKGAVDVVTDYLTMVHGHAWAQLRAEIDDIVDHIPVELYVTYPAQWSGPAIDATLGAARRAGFQSKPGDSIFGLSEPMAAARTVFDQFPHVLKEGDMMLVCDAGGGTVDLGAYQACDAEPHLYMRELTTARGARCGSTAVDSRFYALMEQRFQRSFSQLPLQHVGPGSPLMERFELYKSQVSLDTASGHLFYLPLNRLLHNADPAHYRAESRHIVISAGDMRSLLQPVVGRILALLFQQYREAKEMCRADAVAGLSTPHPLLRHALRGLTLLRELAVVRGALLYGCRRGPPLKIKCPRWYGFGNPHDWFFAKGTHYADGDQVRRAFTHFYGEGEPFVATNYIHACEEPADPATMKSSLLQLNLETIDMRPLQPLIVDGRTRLRVAYTVQFTFLGTEGRIAVQAEAYGRLIAETSFPIRR
ncbi:hypothetical protein BO70DRAFT_407654, partial [Aspergillus heteromorphus CBS 117.55]